MKLKTSFYNRNIVLNDLKLNNWIGILYFVILFFVMPISVLFDLNHKGNFYYNSRLTMELLKMHNGILIISYLIIPILAGVFIIKYIHKKNSASVMHSMPFTREEAFFSHFISGSILLSLPIIINGIFLILISMFTNSIPEFTISKILGFIAMSVVFNISMFVFSLMVSTITGKSSAQVILTYIFLVLPIGIYTFTSFLISKLLYGYVYFNNSEKFFIKLSPFTNFFEKLVGEGIEFSISEMNIYLLHIIVFLIGGIIFYKFRDSEKAEELITFDVLKKFYKIGVTYCFSITLGVYFAELFSNDEVGLAFYFAIIFGGFIGYLVAEISLTKSVVGVKKYKDFLIYAIVIIIMLVSINLDIIGFEWNVPEISRISTIEVFDSSMPTYRNQNPENMKGALFSHKEDFVNIEKFHSYLVENKNDLNIKDENKNYYFLELKYNLLDGKTVNRQYEVYNLLDNEYYKKIMNTREYKYKIHPILSEKVDNIKYITISNNFTYLGMGNKKEVWIEDKRLIYEFYTALEKDILNSKPGDGKYLADIVINFEKENGEDVEKNVFGNNITLNEVLNSNYDAVISFLNKYGYLDSIVPKAENILKTNVLIKESKVLYSTSDFEKISSILKKTNLNWGYYDNFYTVEFETKRGKFTGQILIDDFNEIE